MYLNIWVTYNSYVQNEITRYPHLCQVLLQPSCCWASRVVKVVRFITQFPSTGLLLRVNLFKSRGCDVVFLRYCFPVLPIDVCLHFRSLWRQSRTQQNINTESQHHIGEELYHRLFASRCWHPILVFAGTWNQFSARKSAIQKILPTVTHTRSRPIHFKPYSMRIHLSYIFMLYNLNY